MRDGDFEVVWNGVNDGRNGDLMPSTRRLLGWRDERQAQAEGLKPPPPPPQTSASRVTVFPDWSPRPDAQASASRVLQVLLHADRPFTLADMAMRAGRTTTTVKPIVAYLHAQGRVTQVTPPRGPIAATYAIVTDYVS